MKKMIVAVLAVMMTLTLAGCPNDKGKSGPKPPDKDVLSLYEKSKELDHRLRNTVTDAQREEWFLEKEKSAEKWDIKTTGSKGNLSCGTDEAGLDELAGVYIGYAPTALPRVNDTEIIAYVYLGKEPDANGLYSAYIHYDGTDAKFSNCKDESSYVKELQEFPPFSHAGSWKIERMTDSFGQTETVIRITLVDEMKKDAEDRLRNDHGSAFVGETEWVHDLGHPYLIDGKKTIVSIDANYIKMD